MNKPNALLWLLILLLCNTAYSQQITINNNLPVNTLIEDNLAEGCIELSNITSQVNGSVNNLGSFGSFERGNSNFPFANGIMLSTGNATSGGNTENTDTLNEGESNWGTDPDLESTLGISGTLNATSITFNFISASNQIQFNYILASEEYHANFPCNYSDGFAFLIREAGSGSIFTNIAVIPGSSTPVNTNTIHNEIVGFCNAENEQYFNGYNVGDTNFNGRTNVLSASASITPDVLYEIKLVIADQNDENYDSAVFIEGNSFSATVDLGSDIQTCADTVTVDADIENPNATYAWYLDGEIISGANQTSLNIMESGNYNVIVNIPFASSTCLIEDSISVILSSTQSINTIFNYEICDDLSGNGFEIFDLSTKNNEILNALPSGNYSISYHDSLSDSENNTNPITTPIQNTTNPETIYVKTINTDTGCLGYTTFDLIVNELPSITTPTDLSVCDDATADRITATDLSLKNDEITASQLNLSVTYYATQQDANAGINSLAVPYTNTNPTETIYTRVQNTNTGCYSTTFFNLTIEENPIINTSDFHYIDACDKDYDGFATFDLTSIIPDVLQGLTNVTVTFHETLNDAELDENAISNDTNYENAIIEEQTLYIRVENNNTGCASFVPVEIHPNLLLTATSIDIIQICDIDNDINEGFDLEDIAQSIIGPIRDIIITFYETETDRDNQTNPIDDTVPFEVNSLSQDIYITISSPTCTESDDIELILTPIDEFQSIGTVDYCDTDQNGFTNINLRTFDTDVTNNQSGFTVSYYLTNTDAVDNVNALGDNYTNTQNPQLFHTRITNDVTRCYDTNTFEVQVLLAPEANAPNPIIRCNLNQDTTAIIDLTASESEIISDRTDRAISYHTSLNDANNSANEITNPSSYTASSTTLYARIENTISGCFSTEAIPVIVNGTPVFIAISNYKACENASDGFADFIMSTKDTEILNGQSGKSVSYFLNEADAMARSNPIDKNSNYENITNPQTIYTRVENITDINCYATSSFIIEVGTNPLFNEPTDWFICDDISNDARETFDLTTKISEVSNGINDTLDVSFYENLNDAENTTNAISLQYNNISNPQSIYVVIDNGTICNSITTFSLNIIQVPEVNNPQPITNCDEDYDGLTDFDLTASAVDILDVRQDNIEVHYFETIDDLENHTNVITAPDSYTNKSNPQTVFVKVTNTISNCYVHVPLELIVNTPPAINDFEIFETCDLGTINLNAIDTILLDSNTDIQIQYYSSNDDALNNENELSSNYQYQTNLDTVYAKATNMNTQCATIYPFQIQVNSIPIANQPNNLGTCDEDFDGFFEFDLTQQNATILGSQHPSDFTITFYTDMLSAENKSDAITSTYEAINNEMIFARVENNSTTCFNITEFKTIVNPRPIVNIEDQVICLESLPLVVTADTTIATDSYSWSNVNTSSEIGTDSEVEITQIGTYSVTVTTANGCETYDEFSVSISEQATIETTETVDFSDPNNITVTVSGIGNYAYALNDGEPQTDNVFRNVGIGNHTLTIIDLNGCLEATKDVVVIDTPKFMTPNNDGLFDTWHITGVRTLPGTYISIFDRQGKLIKTLTDTSPGWDGTYNGASMPSSDYWFVADVNYKGQQMQFKGHFTLKR